MNKSILLCTIVAAGLVGPGTAATVGVTSPNDVSSGNFGKSVTVFRDLNSDGIPELLVGAPGEDNSRSGYLYVFDPAAQSFLTEIENPFPESDGEFGKSSAVIPDVTGDGISDIVVGSKNGFDGTVYLLNGATYELVQTFEPSASFETNDGSFADAIMSTEDSTGDGKSQLWFGAPQQKRTTSSSNGGMLYRFDSNSTTTTSLVPGAGGTSWAASLEVLEDQSNDSETIEEIVIGGSGTASESVFPSISNLGRVEIRDSGTLELIGDTLFAPEEDWEDSLFFGESVLVIPDINGDGKQDLVVGADGASNLQGRLYIYSMDDGTPTLIRRIASPYRLTSGSDRADFGSDIALYEDVTGDGYPELLVAAAREANADPVLYIIDPVGGGWASRFPLQGDNNANIEIVTVPDLGSDGIADIVVGVSRSVGTSGQGQLFIIDGEVTNSDTTAPVPSIVRDQSSPTNGDTFFYTVAFDEDINGTFDSSDISPTGDLAGNASLNLSGSGTTYTVELTLDTPNLNGTVGFAIDGEVSDLAGQFLALTTSPLYEVDNFAPSVNTVGNPSPTFQDVLRFTATSFEELTVTASDIVVTGTLAAGATVDFTQTTSPFGTTYEIEVTLADPDADGTIGVSIVNPVSDFAGNLVFNSFSFDNVVVDNSLEATFDEDIVLVNTITGVLAVDTETGNRRYLSAGSDFQDSVIRGDGTFFRSANSMALTGNTLYIEDSATNDVAGRIYTVDVTNGDRAVLSSGGTGITAWTFAGHLLRHNNGLLYTFGGTAPSFQSHLIQIGFGGNRTRISSEPGDNSLRIISSGIGQLADDRVIASGIGGLIAVSLSDGTRTIVNASAPTFTDISEGSGTIYGVTQNGNVYTINANDASTTMVATRTSEIGPDLSNIESVLREADGTFMMTSSNDPWIVRLDPTTGITYTVSGTSRGTGPILELSSLFKVIEAPVSVDFDSLDDGSAVDDWRRY